MGTKSLGPGIRQCAAPNRSATLTLEMCKYGPRGSAERPVPIGPPERGVSSFRGLFQSRQPISLGTGVWGRSAGTADRLSGAR